MTATATPTPDRGLIGPMMKAYAHAFFIHFAELYGFTVDDTDAQAELWAGIEHLDSILTSTPMLTDTANKVKDDTLEGLKTAVAGKTKAAVTNTLAILGTFALTMDRELLGIDEATLDPTGS